MKKLKIFALVSIFHLEYLDIYNEMYNEIKSKEQQFSLDINKVIVTSSFGNCGVSKRVGIDIGIKDTSFKMNVDSYKTFGNLLNVSKINENLNLQLGYGMRCLNIIGDRTSVDITTGSHCAITNTISFDAKIYNILGKDAMIHRFGHEMLHEFGYPEEMVLSMENDFYYKIKNFSDDILLPLTQNIAYAEYSLEERMETLFGEKTKANNILMHLYEYILKNIGYTSNEEMICTHPITNKPIQIPIF